MPEYQILSVRVKVVGKEDAIEVNIGLMKQDYWISDATWCCKVVTWEENVGLLSVGEWFKLSGLCKGEHTRGRDICQFQKRDLKFV